MHFVLPKACCIACRFRRELCLCERVRPLSLPLSVVVVMHAKENRKSSNTGHLVRLALPSSELRVHGYPGRPARFDDLRDDGMTFALYPGRGGRTLTPEVAAALTGRTHTPEPAAAGAGRPLRLVVPDGNWGQASRMMKRVPELAALPCLELPPLEHTRERDALRQRRNHDLARVSTYEAIAAAVGALYGRDAEDGMLSLYDDAASRMMAMRGKIKVAEVPGLR